MGDLVGEFGEKLLDHVVPQNSAAPCGPPEETTSSHFGFPPVKNTTHAIECTQSAHLVQNTPYRFKIIVTGQVQRLLLPLHSGLPPAPSAAPPPHGGRGFIP